MNVVISLSIFFIQKNFCRLRKKKGLQIYHKTRTLKPILWVLFAFNVNPPLNLQTPYFAFSSIDGILNNVWKMSCMTVIKSWARPKFQTIMQSAHALNCHQTNYIYIMLYWFDLIINYILYSYGIYIKQKLRGEEIIKLFFRSSFCKTYLFF